MNYLIILFIFIANMTMVGMEKERRKRSRSPESHVIQEEQKPAKQINRRQMFIDAIKTVESYYKQGKYQDALDLCHFFDKQSTYTEFRIIFWYHLGHIQQALHKDNEAIISFRKVIACEQTIRELNDSTLKEMLLASRYALGCLLLDKDDQEVQKEGIALLTFCAKQPEHATISEFACLTLCDFYIEESRLEEDDGILENGVPFAHILIGSSNPLHQFQGYDYLSSGDGYFDDSISWLIAIEEALKLYPLLHQLYPNEAWITEAYNNFIEIKDILLE